jgi:hypothetical protein
MKIMTHSLGRLLSLGLVCAALTTGARAEETQPGYAEFGKLTASSTAEQFVEVNLQGALLKLAAQVTKKNDPDVAELIGGIQRVRVNVVGLGDDNREDISKRVENLREELVGKGWERIVQAKENQGDVSIYLKTGKEGVVQGVVVTVLDGTKEAVLVNVVGNIRLDQLGKVGERLNIEPLKNLGGTTSETKSGDPKTSK